MSYDIYIGEAVSLVDKWENDEGGEEFTITVNSVELEEAPCFPNDHMTGKKNHRHPGYSQWADFCRDSGLHGLFFDKNKGLMRKHPGTFALNQNHLAEIRQAKEKWIEKNPGKTPGFAPDKYMKREFQDPITNPDPILARIVWLEFWVDWALKNCKNPAIHNY